MQKSFLAVFMKKKKSAKTIVLTESWDEKVIKAATKADAAIIKSIGKQKFPESKIAG